MIPLDAMMVFFAASLLLAMAPGPDNIFVLTQSAMCGRVAGLAITLGLCTGLIVHTMLVTFGVAVIFQTSAVAFTVLKLVGAAYLAYLGWQAFRASGQDLRAQSASPLSLLQFYRRGIFMNVTNPKVSVFFLAFLPQFTDAARGPIAPQMLLLGGLFIVATIIVFGTISLLAGTLGQWLARSSRAQKILNRITGTVLVLLALRLALAER